MTLNDYKKIVLEISNKLENNLYNDELVAKTVRVNNDITEKITTFYDETENKKYVFEIIKIQYRNTKTLYKLGAFKRFYYKKFCKFYKLEQLKNSIEEYSDLLVSKDNDYNSVYLAIDLLKKACTNQLILSLSNTYIDKINLLFDRIMKCIYGSKIPYPKKAKLNRFIKELSNKYLSPMIGLNRQLLKQDLKITIKPISNDFSVKDINFVADKNKDIFKEKSLILNNNHIVELNIIEKLYGLQGLLTFELAYKDGHPDFEFLFDEKQLIFLDIEVLDTYLMFKDDAKKENLSRLTKFVALGNINNKTNIEKQFEIKVTSVDIEKEQNLVKKFEIIFYDPLKTLWELHKPTYIDFKKSLDDLIQDNFFFDKLVKLDSSKSENIKEKIPQVFVSTVNRNFYDFFIEQLFLNKCTIKYDSSGDSDKPTYFITDSVDDSFKQIIKNKLDKISQEFSDFDLISLESQKISTKNIDYHVTKNYLVPDINLKESRNKQINDDTYSENIYKTIICPIDYIESDLPNQENPNQIKWKIDIYANSSLPYLNTKIDLSEIQNKNTLLGNKDLKSIYLVEKKLKFIRSEYCSEKLYRNINLLSYKDDSEKESYEKIAFCSHRNLTHVNNITYSYGDYSKQAREYPNFKSCSSFDIIGKVTIGKNVDESLKKAYKFFSDFQFKEDSFEGFQNGEEKGTNVIYNSKKSLLYAIEIPQEILGPKCSEDPVIFTPVRININSNTNEFMALRNEDVVTIRISGLTQCDLYSIISNSAISTEKTQKKLLQRHNLGAKENCIVSYTEEEDNEIYSIEQINKNNDNSILVHNKKGIFLTYTAKKGE